MKEDIERQISNITHIVMQESLQIARWKLFNKEHDTNHYDDLINFTQKYIDDLEIHIQRLINELKTSS